MFTLTRSLIGHHAQTLLTIVEAALSAIVIFGTGLAFGVAIGFF